VVALLVIIKYGLNGKHFQQIEYRGGGWPGRMLLKTESSTFTIPYLEYWAFLSPWFYFTTCMTCINGLCAQADVSCGDAWIPEFIKTDKKGTSAIVSRTEVGDSLLRQAEKQNYIELQHTDAKSILTSQTPMLNFKHFSLEKR
jgi:coenzyme F420 hydrogenase subunit beta